MLSKREQILRECYSNLLKLRDKIIEESPALIDSVLICTGESYYPPNYTEIGDRILRGEGHTALVITISPN